ncbi:erythromycin esterase family protein [Winogradskyella sp.]|jgi:erythromycin esterase-like protein|uniref:erythromycin esterase family protein n=1 Tax=Winogradskyella sp. TaxID=1883156 RepID=UPI0025E41B49|nr:erythromycin esterase family protein [Winogradskyella sp.]MCT4629807.1 erythromycin esterase family protein [Winogradskyella sp.]
MYLFLRTLVLFLFVPFGYAQCNPKLKPYSNGFSSIEADSFSFLDEALKDIVIVGYGENSHGAGEFTHLTRALMNYLNHAHQFNLLIIETGFGEGAYFNDYIHGKRDDLKAILKTHNSTWRYTTPSFYRLLNWLREHNSTSNNKIYIYGCEMQYVIGDVKRLNDYLKKVNSDFVIDGFEKHLWQTISDDEKSKYYNTYISLKAHFESHYEDFVSKSSKKAYELTYHHIEVIGQFVTTIHQQVLQRKHDFRDIYMEENIEWILHHHGESSKALYWAHNAHVGDWISNGVVDVTGHQLKKRFGDYYFNIATDFGTGSLKAFSKEGNLETFDFDHIETHSFTACLKQLGRPNTFINIRNAKMNAELKAFFENALRLTSGSGAQIRNSKTEAKAIGEAFDAIIYLDTVNEIKWLDFSDDDDDE